uniref:Uncharacterized protein n=1 Tax=Anguilla anguilla TaxID=7936 RepID=A0A0E9Y0T0_ANGAN
MFYHSNSTVFTLNNSIYNVFNLTFMYHSIKHLIRT